MLISIKNVLNKKDIAAIRQSLKQTNWQSGSLSAGSQATKVKANEQYEGGDLQIESSFGSQSIKLKAGDMVLYPSSSLHQVTNVTRGTRLASFFWLQSMVSVSEKRTLLYDLDQSIQALTLTAASDDANLARLTGIYHNLIRQWAVV